MVRVVRLVGSEPVGRVGVGAEGAVRRDVDEASDAGAPSEIYAPNMPADLDSTGAWSVAGGAVTETVSAETASQSRYLEQLFAEFGSSETPASETPGAAPESESRPLVLQRRDPTLPTRD